MLVRFHIPQRITLYGPKGSALDVCTSFLFKRIHVDVCLPGALVGQFPSPHDSQIIYSTRQAENIQVVLRDRTDHPYLQDCISLPERQEDFIKLVTRLALRILTVIRHIGGCPEIPVTLPGQDAIDRLRRWGIERSTDGQQWEKLFLNSTEESLGLGLWAFGLFGSFTGMAWLHVRQWPRIAETLEENKKIQPEDEFYTNATKHLADDNLRLAVLEAVICLEIVLTEFLRTDMSVTKGFKNEQIEKFLESTDLTSRLSGVLGYAIDKSYLKRIDKVFMTVRWRNKITHSTGNIPEEISRDTVKEGIDAVLRLARGLAERRDGILAQEGLNKIATLLKKSWENILTINIRQLPWHEVDIEMWLFPIPSEETMNNMANDASRILAERDKRFVSEEHLKIRFYAGDEQVGYYTFGALLMPLPKTS